jgi:hypothetical protein
MPYYFQQRDRVTHNILNYTRVNLNNPLYPIYDINKPVYYFEPSKTSTVVNEYIGNKYLILGYDHLTKTYALTSNAYDNILSLGLGIKFVKKFSEEKNIVINEELVNHQIWIETYNPTTKVFTFHHSSSADFNSIGTGEFVHLRGVEYITGSNFEIIIEKRDTKNGNITAFNDPLGVNLNPSEGLLKFNAFRTSTDVWGKSFFIPNSSSKTCYTTNKIVYSNVTGLLAPSSFPFKSTYWNTASGMPNLTETAKRNKLTITSYNNLTKTYTLSNTYPFNAANYFNQDYFYNNLDTRIYRNNIVKDVTITQINTGSFTFTVDEDVWGFSYTVPTSALTRNYVLDEKIVIPDDTAGNWRMFPKRISNTNNANISSISFIHHYLSTINALPAQDLNNSNYSVPFSIYFKKTNYKYRYFLPTLSSSPKFRQGQPNPNGRWIYSTKTAFDEYDLKIGVLSTVNENKFTEDFSYLLPTGNLRDIQLINESPSLKSIFYSYTEDTALSYFQVGKIEYENNSTNIITIEPFEVTVSGINTLPYTSLPVGSTFGKKIKISDRYLFVVDDFIKNIYVYLLDGTPYAIIPPPTTINGEAINGIIDFCKVVTAHKQYFAYSFKFIRSYDTSYVNGINVYFDTNGAGKFDSIYQINGSSFLPDVLNTEASNISLTTAQDTNTNKITKVLLYVCRPNSLYFLPYKGALEIHDVNTTKSLLQILSLENSLNSSLTGTHIFGSNVSGDVNSFAVTISSNTSDKNIINIFNLNIYSEGILPTTFTYLTATPIKSLSSNEINFGKQLQLFNQQIYDPYIILKEKDEIITTDRLFIGSNNSITVFEKFFNDYITLGSYLSAITFDVYFNGYAVINQNEISYRRLTTYESSYTGVPIIGLAGVPIFTFSGSPLEFL